MPVVEYLLPVGSGETRVREDGRPCYFVAKYAFVPAERGRWIRTHISVIVIACPYCKAARGYPCINPKNGLSTVGTHYLRRIKAKKKRDWTPRERQAVMAREKELREKEQEEAAKTDVEREHTAGEARPAPGAEEVESKE